MPKTVHRLELTLSDEQWDALNEQRGHEPRASFVKRMLDAGLFAPSTPPPAPATAREYDRSDRQHRLNEAKAKGGK